MQRLEALAYRLDQAGRRELLERFEELGRRGALVGAKGSGKTTLLLELEAHFGQQGWRLRRLRLGEEQPLPSPEQWHRLDGGLGSEHLITVDGAEQLPFWAWWRLRWLARRAGGLLITVHAPGRLPTLREHRTDPALLANLVGELAGEEMQSRLEPDLPRLFEIHDGNLRECLRELYDHWAEGTI